MPYKDKRKLYEAQKRYKKRRKAELEAFREIGTVISSNPDGTLDVELNDRGLVWAIEQLRKKHKGLYSYDF